MAESPVPAGTALVVAAAVGSPDREVFSRREVSLVVALAYELGRTSTWRDDLAELHAQWDRHPLVERMTYEERVARRKNEMLAGVDRERRRRRAGGDRKWDRSRAGDPYGLAWPPVAMPGSGRPTL